MDKPVNTSAQAIDNSGARRSRNRKTAFQLAKVGLWVFPSNGKVPLVPRFNKADTSLTKADVEAAVEEFMEKHEVEPVHVGATRDPEVIKKLWRRFPDAVPSVSCGPSKLVVLDSDVKDGGPAKMAKLFAEIGLPEGVHVSATRSGGRHYVFSDPFGTFTNQAGLLKKLYSTDVRGRNGQFVAPSSIRADGAAYGSDEDRIKFLRAVVSGKLPQLPQEIVELIGASTESETSLSDKDAEVKRYMEELESGEREDHAALFDPVAGKYPLDYIKECRPDFGFAYDHPGEDRSANRMQAATFLVGAYPELSVNDYAVFCEEWDGAGDPDTRQLAREFARAKLNPAHVSKPSDGSAFEAVDDEDDDSLGAKPGLTQRAGELVANYRPIRWLVKRLIPLNSVGALYGLPNVGKSFVVFDLASHARRGREWFGRKTRSGDVLYCYAEGAEGFAGRAKAWADNNDTRGGDVALMDNVPNLFRDSKAAEKLIAAARECEAQSGQPVRLIILDTLAAATTGADGSSDKDMGTVCERLRKVASALDCAVLIVHHSGKDVSKGMRGSSAILGAVDFTLLAEEGKGASMLSVEKMRDASKAQSIRFKLVEVVIGRDEDGEDVTSCIVRPVTVGEGIDMAVDDEEVTPLKVSDRREDRVAMLMGVAREQAEKAAAADEPLSSVALMPAALREALNAERRQFCDLDGKPLALLDRTGVKRVIDKAVEDKVLSERRGRLYVVD
ncbi:AAA family ATPase [Bradyrhizobium neotropicale]|uniref:DNA primase/polymerase bifunctional N-terminal domain-containing protein n=1 Tax=Bradyrhizobium neotropicale TaxID=1497615 RepID=A0A176Z115_9BRAD|nr:AAA family ATPase [Bradyrhizobium neotropicale]OAF14111.1 hypothetical protein AXW67_00510 [Bradyrhizobium neotropicale]